MDLTAITTRDDFLLEVGEALGGQASVRPVDSITGALEYLTSTKRGQVLVIDTRDLLDVRADVDQAHAQAAHAVVIVFATADTEKHIGAALKGSNVFAVLPLPVDKRKTGAVLGCKININVPIAMPVTDDNVDQGPLRIALVGDIDMAGHISGDVGSMLIMSSDQTSQARSFAWSGTKN